MKLPTDISRMGDLRIAHPFKGGIASPIPKVPKGRLNYSRAIPGPEQTVRIGADVGHSGTRPSLRDLCNGSFEPSSELLGYSRISLRETRRPIGLNSGHPGEMEKWYSSAVDLFH